MMVKPIEDRCWSCNASKTEPHTTWCQLFPAARNKGAAKLCVNCGAAGGHAIWCSFGPRPDEPRFTGFNLPTDLEPVAPTPSAREPVAPTPSARDRQEGGDHYKKLKIQPVEYIHANGIGFAEGNVIKYVSRWRDKGGVADLEKARHFIDLLIELESK